MTRNLSLDRYDAMHAEKRGGGEVPLVLDELAEVVADEKAFPADTEGLSEVLNAFLGGLKPDAGNIFLRRYRFGDSVQEDGCSYSVEAQAHPLTEEKNCRSWLRPCAERGKKRKERVLSRENRAEGRRREGGLWREDGDREELCAYNKSSYQSSNFNTSFAEERVYD